MKAGVQGAGVIEDKVWSKGAVILEFVLGTSLFLLVDWDKDKLLILTFSKYFPTSLQSQSKTLSELDDIAATVN